MTAGNNGTGTPEKDDPFAHLYRSEGGEGPTDSGPAAHQPGVPRTSHHQVRPVGSRQYGQQAQRPQQPPAPHYAAPETLPGGQQPIRTGGHGGHGGGNARPNRRGLLIAAIAVVVVVAGGIGAAMVANSGGAKDEQKTSANGGDNKPADEPSKKEKEPDKKKETPNPSAAALPKRDAASLRLIGGASTSTDVAGAKAEGGAYAGINSPGQGVEWEVEVPKDGTYRLNVTYGVPGKDTYLAVAVNGTPNKLPIRLQNHGNTKEGEWSSNWMTSWTQVDLKQGKNKLLASCAAGTTCDVHLDQVLISAG
ncbi:carbohydrate-binding protein [Streptomyces sp. ISL-11]|uniref:carbohydrate-binding protein n=1 Tax=Streptomyces sp. ISL-11 TaxID=2819174 RepID=UPI001BE5C201|nr:carbohydrate-binding protein [Streptomyces sp. ISL-11]MBT2382276.1 carbohydrate-binding protein [Streptomyces sp. ISL-11]